MRFTFAIAACALLALGAAPSRAAEPIELRVMTFNVWYGGDQVSVANVGEAIRAANADIVGLQEADRNLMHIAKAAGMPFVDTRRRILSRWPIFDSGTGERTDTGPAPYSITALDRDALQAWVMVEPGRVVAVSNVHLLSSPSGVGAARGGSSAADVYAMERATRGAEAEPLAALGKLAERGIPVFLTGDFNSASYLDWTEAVHRARPDIPYAFAWPATKVLADAGLRDSYREIYPDSHSAFDRGHGSGRLRCHPGRRGRFDDRARRLHHCAAGRQVTNRDGQSGGDSRPANPGTLAKQSP